MGLFFNGASVRVEGTLPPDHDAVIVCVGDEKAVELKRKGKVWGLLWMSVGDVAFERVPTVYALSSSRRLADLAPAETREQLGLGHDALASRAGGAAVSAEQRVLFGELCKLKEGETLFSVDEDGVDLEPATGGGVTASTVFRLPARTPPGEYEVRLYAFMDQQAKLVGSGTLSIGRSGPVSVIARPAHDHGLLYGIVAVVIALGVGLLTGFVFGLGGKRRR